MERLVCFSLGGWWCVGNGCQSQELGRRERHSLNWNSTLFARNCCMTDMAALEGRTLFCSNFSGSYSKMLTRTSVQLRDGFCVNGIHIVPLRKCFPFTWASVSPLLPCRDKMLCKELMVSWPCSWQQYITELCAEIQLFPLSEMKTSTLELGEGLLKQGCLI